MSSPRSLFAGDPAPRFRAPSSMRPMHHFDLQAGRFVVLSFVSERRATEHGFLAALARIPLAHKQPVQHWFVLRQSLSEAEQAAINVDGWARYFVDPQDKIRQAYGIAADMDLASFVITPRFMLAAMVSLADVTAQVERIHAILNAQVPIAELPRVNGPAPVLVIPHVFEPDFCTVLIEGYKRYGGHQSYHMDEVNGRTVPKLDSSFKVRRDWLIEDQNLMAQIVARLIRRVVPEIQRAYNFAAEHAERHLVACYAASDGGHFAAHRDTTSKGTEHRRFACSLNLNDEYEGGGLIFPEFGMQQYRPPRGSCVIFSAALLHQANRVTAGERFAYLPFLHDSAAQAVLERNMHLIDAPPVHT